MTVAYSSRGTAAKSVLSGFVSAKAQWIEDLIIRNENGENVVDVDAHDWVFQFRKSGTSTSADLSLTTATDGGLTVTETNGVTTLSIDTDLHADLCGDYVADIASEDSDSKRYHWAHGTITFNNDPVAF